MNLLFRLLWVMLRATLSAKHSPIMTPANLQFRVWLTDQDMFLHMTNSRYLSFSDLGRMDLFIRSGFRGVVKNEQWSTEICGQTMTINRMLKAPKLFTLETQLHGWDDQFLVIGQRFMRNGKNHAGVVTLLELHDRSGTFVPPQSLIDQIEPGVAPPPLSQAFTDLIASTNTSRSSENQ